eukprot:TRINITY_DN4101_c0_g1_i10.p1 TRINITY_DN4101_c0_g1~~TRINITY_DN4101_c0_g1_i10.p1  ORF type:complete len:102 (+),score=20.80 TRINITY_DN4101_c0_g1_i10:672-977(+)
MRADGECSRPFTRKFRFLYPNKGSLLYRRSQAKRAQERAAAGAHSSGQVKNRDTSYLSEGSAHLRVKTTRVKRMGFGQGIVTPIRTPGRITTEENDEDFGM